MERTLDPRSKQTSGIEMHISDVIKKNVLSGLSEFDLVFLSVLFSVPGGDQKVKKCTIGFCVS